jgi:hypothetical protein
MIDFIKNIWKKFKDRRKIKKMEKIYKERLEELKKRDPFIYRH